MGITRNLKQDVTHWPVTGSDGFGGFAFGAGVLLAGRWEDKQELFLTPDGEEVISEAVVYLAADVSPGDYLYLGDQITETNPGTLSGARRIRGYGKVTNLTSSQALRKCWL